MLNFDGVDHVSSAGLRTILVLAKRLEPDGGSVVLAQLQPDVDEVFEISGFKSFFENYVSLATALTKSGMPTSLCDEVGKEQPEREGDLGRFASRILPGRFGN
ncbi:MAG: STAS domain-containing protein [Boseongicola sp.]|nr:STAS domain-containing protein [Boseongicola sp.]